MPSRFLTTKRVRPKRGKVYLKHLGGEDRLANQPQESRETSGSEVAVSNVIVKENISFQTRLDSGKMGSS